MTHHPIRVGIIGADTKASWAGAAHVPALAAQPQFELAAVATRRAESARGAAEVFGAGRWFADPFELIADPAIDLVTVAVKVPAHRDLVLAALAAGKALYSESPLGTSVAETEEMAAAVGPLHTAIGLQGRHNPSVRRAAGIVAEGRLGRLLSARVTATTFGNGPESASAYEYFDKAEAGAGLLQIAAAHVLDVVEAVLGDITEVDARTELLWPEVALADTGATTVREVPDHLDAVVKTGSGAPVSVQVLAGVPVQEAEFRLEVRGTAGRLMLTGNHPAGVQVGDLTLSSDVEFAAPDLPVASGTGPTAAEIWTGASINVGEVYASLARDLTEGTHRTPGFRHAAHNSRLVARVAEAARTGIRQ
ncbi:MULTISPECIES: Gfo/Idh/MocA family protein [Pseudonocardia]|uniref:1,5-anhydro-D-fructose reductase n=2 Tax=Pseudonocardia TaxID=1847 RepID=A0A1Y2N2C4_PSEAH|nr:MULTISPECIES: Gfo/Idh/MocA family oxidoreductase [Pseudonocardia]OSY41267.1 1,5-anhydro-D-fructose reductase [Pseudonocardia autotrophica]TDN76722.1 putative dehydrogenase [Pseudonocardia autotrophica]BBG00724.1 oxidoreductase [Pseudonocardia autotrophica]GEC24310.1 oxidoreductase [Pseudonocardia saturnea]